MNILRAFLFGVLLHTAYAQPSILQSDPLSCFAMSGEPSSDLTIVDVAGQSFTRAMHIKTEHNSANIWDIRIRCFNMAPVQQNDTILATFWMRAAGASATGFTSLVIEKGVDPYTKSVNWTAQAGPEWKKFTIPFRMAETYTMTGTQTYNVSFWVTFDPQEIEIGGFTMLNYGQNVPFSSLPLVNWPYEGHDLDASWRTEAAARIDKIRKGELVVVVHDNTGLPIPNAQVHIEQKKHSFGFGTAIAAAAVADTSANGQKYRDTLQQNYNKIVFENDLKWPFWEDTRNWPRSRTMGTLDWLDQNGFTQKRGHNLIWPGKTNLPSDVVTMLSGPQDTLRNRIYTHFSDVLGVTKGRLSEWDVVNEPVANHDVQDVLGEEPEMALWYKKARDLEPGAKLYINDYDILEAGGINRTHQDAYLGVIQRLIQNGAPLDGIGLQSHFDSNLTPPVRVFDILNRFATFGKDLQITEFDVNLDDEQLQADYLRDFLTITFSHPAVKGFVMWGFWEGRHWLPKAALWRMNWDIKPIGLAWQDLVYKQWWTNVTGTTGADGIFRTRGFLGDYTVSITADGAARTSTATLSSTGPVYVSSGKVASATIRADSVLNGASFVSGAVTPGEIVTIKADGIGAPEGVVNSYNADGQLGTVVADTRVYFDGTPAPVIHSYPGQVSAVVPYSVSGTTAITVEHLGAASNAVSVPVTASAPGIFMCGPAFPNTPVLINASAGNAISCTTAWKPVSKGDVLTLFITGEGQTNPAGIDGKLPGSPVFPAPAQPVEVRFGAASVKPLFAGLIYAGVTQVNVAVPDSAVSGTAVPLVVSVGGTPSQAGVTVAIR